MARCTAPSRGHRTESGRQACPACGGGYRGYRGYRGYSSYTSYPSYYSSTPSTTNHTSSNGRRSKRVSWAPSNSTILYTDEEVRTLTPVRKRVEERSILPDLRDVFLCHAWDDRKNAAKELHDLLEQKGVSVWFSEKDVLLGSSLLREIDKGLVKSRVGIVLVTPSFLKRITGEGVADKELSALLARDLLVPIVHGTTYEDLREVSPLLGSRSGLNTTEESMEKIADKLSELVNLE